MKIAQIDATIAEAERFIKSAKALKAAKQKLRDQYYKDRTTLDYVSCPREQGALRRASMDLTRSLSDLRKPG